MGEKLKEGYVYYVFGNVYESFGDFKRVIICGKIFF